MLLSIILTFASLPAVQAQAQTHVAMTVDKVGCQVWLANMYAVEFVRRSTGPRGRYRKTYEMIDAMLAKQNAEFMAWAIELGRSAQARAETATNPYTPDEATALLKALKGAPRDQLNDILTKFEAQRELSKKKAP